MKKTFLFIFLFLIFQIGIAKTIPSNIELVESVPLKTFYEHSKVMRAEPVWLDMINNAKQTIDIGAFYFISTPKSSMSHVVDAIKEAANRGVQVRLLLDETFKPNSQTAIDEFSNVKNIQLLFMPMKNIAGGVLHAKYMIVDDEKVFVGSQNFDWRALDQNHEIGIYVDNKRLAETILSVFNSDWEKSGGTSVKQADFIPVTEQNPVVISSEELYPAFSPENITPNGLNIEIKQLIQLLNQAKKEVLIQVMQYSTSEGYKKKGYWDELDNAIRHAAARGVHINMIVANWALKKPDITALKSLSLIPNVHIKYSAIPDYQGKFIPYSRVEHCKYMIIDKNIAWIGTGNWEKDYFYSSRDLAIIVKGQYPAKTLRKIFYRDWFGSYVRPIYADRNYFPPKTH